MQRGIYDEEIIEIMHAPPRVGNGGFRVVPHATGAGLVLAGAEMIARWVAPHLYGPAGQQPLFSASPHVMGGAHRFGMGNSLKARYRQAITVAHIGVESHPTVGVRDLMHRAHHVEGAPIVLSHPALVLQPAAREVGWL